MNYDTYRNNMLKQGKQPLSREEFELNKEDALLKADELKMRASMMGSESEDGKFSLLGFVGKILTSFANSAEKLLK